MRRALYVTVALAGLGIGALLGPIGASAAEIYRWTDGDGVPHFSDERPERDVAIAVLDIADTNPPDYDPRTYVEASFERWDALLAETAVVVGPKPETAPPPAPQVLVLTPPLEVYPHTDLLWLGGRSAFFHGPPRPPVRVPAQEPLPPPDVPRALLDLERTAHPARSAQRPGRDLRYGVLGHRVTHPKPPSPVLESDP